MSYTPYINLTDREFCTMLANIKLPTDTEIEAMKRIDGLLARVADLESEAADDVVVGVVDPLTGEVLV